MLLTGQCGRHRDGSTEFVNVAIPRAPDEGSLGEVVGSEIQLKRIEVRMWRRVIGNCFKLHCEEEQKRQQKLEIDAVTKFSSSEDYILEHIFMLMQ